VPRVFDEKNVLGTEYMNLYCLLKVLFLSLFTAKFTAYLKESNFLVYEVIVVGRIKIKLTLCRSYVCRSVASSFDEKRREEKG
jgi:hypothetical protein